MTSANRPPRLTPLARRWLADHDLDPTRLPPGPPGRRLSRRHLVALLAPVPPAAAPSPNATPHGSAATMSDAPTAWMASDVDLTPLLTRLGSRQAAQPDRPLPLLAVLLHATGRALTEQPSLNAAWAGTTIRRFHRLHLAVSRPTLDQQLVIADADQQTAAQLAAQLVAPLGPASVVATFTVIDLTASPGQHLQPLVPVGQAACLSIGAPTWQLVAINDTIARRAIARLAVAFDHRVLDGAPVGLFLRALRQWLERAAEHAPLW